MAVDFSSLGSVCAVLGAQWGDEGKGKIVDMLGEHFDVIARASGGANAGHTIVVSGKKHVFHLLPAACLHPGKPIVLGAGMMIHLPTLVEEIRTLEEAGVSICERLYLSSASHVVCEYHKVIDAQSEDRRAKEGMSIGTTKRGIGPAYADKVSREGLRMECLRWNDAQLHSFFSSKATFVREQHGVAVDIAQEMKNVAHTRELLSTRVIDHIAFTMQAFLDRKMRVLIEGAQAALLDIDHGTYPYVTSSATTAAGALQGLGLPPRVLSSCIGIAKAYCTRVGAGNFLTEAKGSVADRLRERGGEYGATTGRPRRCGWLFLPDLVYAAALNGFSSWNMTKLDVLDDQEEIPVGMGLTAKGEVRYEMFPGWKTSTSGITDFDALPRQAQSFILSIEANTKIPVQFVGTGQERGAMVVRACR